MTQLMKAAAINKWGDADSIELVQLPLPILEVDDVLIKGDEKMLLLIPIAIIITTLCKGIATYLHSFQMSKVAHNIY
mgnify:CR=1 FL=1